MTDAIDLIENYRTERQARRDTAPPRIVASALFDGDGGRTETMTAVFDASATLADVMVWSQNLRDSVSIADYLSLRGPVARPTRLVISPDLNSLPATGNE